MKNNKAVQTAELFDRLARKHYQTWKSGRLFLKSTSDIAGAVVEGLPEDQPTQIRAWATRPTVDLEGDVVLPLGMQAEYFKQNRTLFVDHQYDAMSAVGKLRNLIVDRSGVIVESVLIKNPENKLRNQIEALAASGNIGHSIGFEAMDYGPPTDEERKIWPQARIVHRSWRLLEVSYTAMPMNGSCQSDLVPESLEQMPKQRTVVIL